MKSTLSLDDRHRHGSGRGHPQNCVSDEVAVEQFLTQLDDDVNRTFLSMMSSTWHTAQELSAATETPLSTTYRKLGTLDGVGLLDQRLRVCPNGNHPEEYRAKPLLLTFTIGEEGGVAIDVTSDLPD